MFQTGTCPSPAIFTAEREHSLCNILPDQKKVEIAHAGGMDCDNREARTPLSVRKQQKVALRRPKPQLVNLCRSNPEGALLRNDARRAGELPAPALPPKIGLRREGREDAAQFYRHPVGIHGRLHVLS